MTTKEWIDIIIKLLPYVFMAIGFLIVTWANSNYVNKKYLAEVLKAELDPIKKDVEKTNNLHHEFGIFKAEYKGDAALQNKQMDHMNDLLKNISEQVKVVNNKIK